MRKQAVTVRLPVARIAPANKTLACSQTGLENSGANSTIKGNNSAGSMGIWKTSLGGKFFRSLCGLPLLFQRPKLDKVELSPVFEICNFSINAYSSENPDVSPQQIDTCAHFPCFVRRHPYTGENIRPSSST